MDVMAAKKRVEDDGVAGRGGVEEVAGCLLGRGAGGGEDLGGAAMQGKPAAGVDGVVDSGAHDRVEELDRPLAPEQVDAYEPGRRLPGGNRIEA